MSRHQYTIHVRVPASTLVGCYKFLERSGDPRGLPAATVISQVLEAFITVQQNHGVIPYTSEQEAWAEIDTYWVQNPRAEDPILQGVVPLEPAPTQREAPQGEAPSEDIEALERSMTEGEHMSEEDIDALAEDILGDKDRSQEINSILGRMEEQEVDTTLRLDTPPDKSPPPGEIHKPSENEDS